MSEPQKREYTDGQHVKLLRRLVAFNAANQVQSWAAGDIVVVDAAIHCHGFGWRYRLESGGYLGWAYSEDITAPLTPEPQAVKHE